MHRSALLLLIAAICGSARADVFSQTVGFTSATHATGASGLAQPLIATTLFTGVVASNTLSTLTAGGANLNLGAKLAADQPCYVEITSGPLVGHRFDVDIAVTIDLASAVVGLDLSAASHSTLASLDANSLLGAGFALRRHATLATLQARFSPALVGSDDPSVADSVTLYDPSGGGYTLYHLRADGATWRRPGSTTDQRARVIPPDQSLVVRLRSGAKTSVLVGEARGHAFRLNLAAGQQAFATGFPVPLSLAAAPAESVRVLPAGASVFTRYHLSDDGASWLTESGANVSASSAPLAPDAALLVSRATAATGLLIANPAR